MRDYEKALVSCLLDMASDEFSNHGCNDFDLARIVPDKADRDALVREFYGDEEEVAAPGDGPDYRLMDWMLFRLFADRLAP